MTRATSGWYGRGRAMARMCRCQSLRAPASAAVPHHEEVPVVGGSGDKCTSVPPAAVTLQQAAESRQCEQGSPSCRLRVRGMFCVTTFLLVVWLACSFRASVTSLWQRDGPSTSASASAAQQEDVDVVVAAGNLTPPAPGTGASWDPAAVYQFACLDQYAERVEKPIIARLLRSVISSSGAVHIGGPAAPVAWTRHRKEKQQAEAGAPDTSWRRLPWQQRPSGRPRRLESWEADLSRARYQPHWPRFLHLLREWAAARRFDPQVMKELPHMVGAANASGVHKTCAVVGNSGILLRGHHGRFIDSHDMVIRINGANTRNYERQVGSKTTLAFSNSHMLRSYARISGPSGCRFPYSGRVPLLVYICQAAHLMDVALCQAGSKAPTTSLLMVTDPRLDVLCARIAKWYSVKEYLLRGGTSASLRDWESKHGGIFFHYSSGMQAVVLALGLCERVHLFGFGKVAGVKHHYHGLQKGEFSLHDYAAEYAFYHDLENNGSAAVAFLNQTQGFLVPPLRVFL